MKKKNLLKSYKLRENYCKIPLLATDKRLLELESQHKNIIDSLREFQRLEKLSSENLVRLINLPQESIPVSIFNIDLPPLEAVVFYLNKFAHIRKIAELLGRSEKTIWTTRKNSSGKEVVIDESGRLRIPVKILADRRFSILENVVRYLRDGVGLRQIEIANMLGKDRRAVWTVYNRAKKKGAINEDFADLISADETKILEFESKHKTLIDSLRDFQRSEKLSSEEIARIINLPQESIPVSVFNIDLPPLEAVVFYLNKFTDIRKIADLLGRSEKTIWTTHKNSSDKDVRVDDTSRIRVPVKILADRRFSILENVVRYLRDEAGLRQIEIANILGKDRRAVWTVYSRAGKKQELLK